MRFAYIDSQGNEVPIPGVDALALRIQLGAVGPDTDLYDAQADRWGPARSHEIFLTLARDSEEEGFVAPPPPVRRPPTDAADAAPSLAHAGLTAGAALEEGPEEAPEEESEELRFDLTPLASTPDAPEADPAEGGERADPDGAAPDVPAPEVAAPDVPLTFDLADDLAEARGALAPAPGPVEVGGTGDASDAGDPGEPSSDPPREEPGAEGILEFHGELELDLPGEAEEGSGEAEGMLELERPLSEYEPDAPPLWMEQEGPGEAAEEDPLEFEPVAADAPTDPPVPGAAVEPARRPVPEARRPGPRSRPSPPRRPPQRAAMAPVVWGVALLLVGVGGWFGWRTFQGAGASDSRVPDLPEVTIPSIPAELLPTFRDVGEAALGGMVAELERRAGDAGLPAEPRQDWLSGSYLANAGQYPDVVAYWEGMEAFVARVREADARLFHESYEAELATREVAVDTATMLLERADSGFLATRRERWEAYLQMEDLVDAALALHSFLRENEGEIDYEPAVGGMSADPVLEAVPSSRELGNEMWSRVDQITEALDRLGTLDRVTTERLTAVLFDRIRRAGFR